MNETLVLEIGNPFIKVAVFRSALNAHYLKGLSVFTAQDLSDEIVLKSIGDFLKKLKIKKPQLVIASFSRNSVTLRNLRIPSANPGEIEDMIKLHVGRQVPYAKEEIVSGYRINGQDGMGYAKVMLAIVHRESIRRVYKILEKGGLYPDRVELSSDGILAWLSKAMKPADLKTDDAFIILDVDSNFTDFLVATSENILFSRVITLGSDHLSDETKWPKFMGEMKQTIVISQGEEVLQKPSKVFLTGSAVGLKGLSSRIEQEFNLPTQAVEAFENLPLAKEVVRDPEDAAQRVSFSAVMGLGLDISRKKIAFVLPEAQIRKALRERTRETIFFGSVLMYFIAMICGIYLEKMNNRQSYLDLLRSRYKLISVEAESLNEKVERLKRVKAKRDTKSAFINYLYEVSKLLPSEILIMQLNFQNFEKLDLKGRAKEMSDVFKLISILEGSPYFKDIQTRYTTRKKVKGQDVNEFELVCPVEMDESEAKTKKKKS